MKPPTALKKKRRKKQYRKIQRPIQTLYPVRATRNPYLSERIRTVLLGKKCGNAAGLEPHAHQHRRHQTEIRVGKGESHCVDTVASEFLPVSQRILIIGVYICCLRVSSTLAAGVAPVIVSLIIVGFIEGVAFGQKEQRQSKEGKFIRHDLFLTTTSRNKRHRFPSC